ncbi:MAG TPA: indolepyruvate oxidoreductase subunit beta [Methanomicrobiales archaeon]|nr:indolepyruvate oxidoreductase subunit beta [Methanomicrobiales archaeon]
MKGSFDILIVGVGGQGTILTSNILGEACLLENRHVKGAETHGMAQRGGSVESHIRIDGELGPLIPPGDADILIALEMLEAVRYRHWLGPEGMMVVSRNIVVPTSVFTQELTVPTEEKIVEQLKGTRFCLVDAPALAVEAGSPLAQNVVMLGAASPFLPLSPESLMEAVRRSVPKKTIDVNIRAFELGRDAAEQCSVKI